MSDYRETMPDVDDEVRFFDRRLTTEHLFAAGEEQIPLVIGPHMEVMTVLMDPAVLVGPRR